MWGRGRYRGPTFCLCNDVGVWDVEFPRFSGHPGDSLDAQGLGRVVLTGGAVGGVVQNSCA
jgi:hypothetical protein